jgi:hypothetical protein
VADTDPTMAKQRNHGPDIAMWGAPGSGKTAFLAALSIALNNARGAGWILIGRNPASQNELVKLRTILLGEHAFPAPTESLNHYSWTIIGPAEQPRRRWWWPWRGTTARGPRINLDFLDLRGDLYAEPESVDKTALVESLVKSRGLIYMFDPDRESQVGDAFKHLDAALLEVAGKVFNDDGHQDNKLPHYVAVCITKYDDPQVLTAALDGAYAEKNPEDELRLPLVPEDRVRDFFRSLCRDARDHNTEMILSLIETFFHKDRVRYFVTSSVGLFVDDEFGRFDEDDYLNVIKDPSGALRIRGAIRPINVMEPVIWLGRMLRSGTTGSR